VTPVFASGIRGIVGAGERPAALGRWGIGLVRRKIIGAFVAAMATAIAATASADSITDRLAAGEPIRIGFDNDDPFAYPGQNNRPLGFVNAYTLGLLESMGIDDVEPVVIDWGTVIGDLQAGKFDMITGGMYILGSRCQEVNFAEPMGKLTDALIVRAGNPDGIRTLEDVEKNEDAIFATVSGYNQVEYARTHGVPDARILQLADPVAVSAAVRDGRAQVGGVPFFTGLNLVDGSNGEIEMVDPALMPADMTYFSAIAFRKGDTDFLASFNDAQAAYLGSPAMLDAVAPYGYTSAQLPGGMTAAEECANR
jgi:polar amino acid transport system substrate-binding protein